MRGRRLVVYWEHSAEDFQEMLDKERNGHRKARLRALLAIRQGESMASVGQQIGVDYRTIQRWLAWYRKGGLESVLNRTPGHAAPGRPSRLTKDQLNQLLDKFDMGDFRTVWDAVRWVKEQYGVEYTYTGMHALMYRHRRR